MSRIRISEWYCIYLKEVAVILYKTVELKTEGRLAVLH